MEDIGIITLLLIITNGILTYKGLKEFTFFNNFLFNVDRIVVDEDYKDLSLQDFQMLTGLSLGY